MPFIGILRLVGAYQSTFLSCRTKGVVKLSETNQGSQVHGQGCSLVLQAYHLQHTTQRKPARWMAFKGRDAVELAKVAGTCFLATAAAAIAGASVTARNGGISKQQRGTTVGMYFVY